MPKIENFNNYPEGFLEDFNEPVTFKLLGIKKDPDNDDGYLMPSFTNIPATSKVVYKDSDGKSTTVNLALILSSSADGEVEFDIKGLFLGQSNGGQIHLDPKNPKDVEKFNYINHCHFNKSSKYTYEGAGWKVEKFSLESEADKDMESRKDLTAAIVAVSNLSASQIKTLYGKIGSKNPSAVSPSEMKNELEHLAMDSPLAILNVLNKGIEAPAPTEAPSAPESTKKEVEINVVDLEEVEKNLEKSPEDAPSLVLTAVNTGAIKKVMTKLEWRTHSGEVLMAFSKVAEGNGTAEEQLIEALEKDASLFSKVELIISNHIGE